MKKTSAKKEVKKPSIISGVLIVSIAIVTFLFIMSGTNLLLERPSYENFCNDVYADKPATVKQCNNTEYMDCGRLSTIPAFDENGCIKSYTCSDCNLKYDDARNNYEKNIFIISIILGIILILISAKIPVPTIQNGIFISSIITIIRGTGEYWSELNKILQFLLLGLATACVIIIAYKAYKKQTE